MWHTLCTCTSFARCTALRICFWLRIWCQKHVPACVCQNTPLLYMYVPINLISMAGIDLDHGHCHGALQILRQPRSISKAKVALPFQWLMSSAAMVINHTDSSPSLTNIYVYKFGCKCKIFERNHAWLILHVHVCACVYMEPYFVVYLGTCFTDTGTCTACNWCTCYMSTS